jgi:hypothetical protein
MRVGVAGCTWNGKSCPESVRSEGKGEKSPTGCWTICEQAAVSLVSFRKNWLSGNRQPSFHFPSPMNNQETIILNLRIDREKLEKFEHVLTWYQLYGKKAYTPDTYLAEVIEKEYAQVA